MKLNELLDLNFWPYTMIVLLRQTQKLYPIKEGQCSAPKTSNN